MSECKCKINILITYNLLCRTFEAVTEQLQIANFFVFPENILNSRPYCVSSRAIDNVLEGSQNASRGNTVKQNLFLKLFCLLLHIS